MWIIFFHSCKKQKNENLYLHLIRKSLKKIKVLEVMVTRLMDGNYKTFTVYLISLWFLTTQNILKIIKESKTEKNIPLAVSYTFFQWWRELRHEKIIPELPLLKNDSIRWSRMFMYHKAVQAWLHYSVTCIMSCVIAS